MRPNVIGDCSRMRAAPPLNAAPPGQGLRPTVLAPSYPGLHGTAPAPRTRVAVSGPTQPVVTPAGGTPSAITTVPGLGSLSALGGALGGTSVEIPGQFAAFRSVPLRTALDVVGAPTVQLDVSAAGGSATLFAKLYDVGPGGDMTLPSGLVAPLFLRRVSEEPARPTRVEVTLPAIDHRFEVGHTMRLVVSSTDQAYALPSRPAVYSVGLAAGVGTGTTNLAVPQVAGLAQGTSASARWWVLLAVLVGLALAGWTAAELNLM